MPDNFVLLLCWVAAILLWPFLLSFIARPFRRNLPGDLLIDEVRGRIGTAYHELAHAILGLPFLMIPTRIKVWDDGAELEGKPRGYVKQSGFTILPFFGQYFSCFAPVLIGLFLTLISMTFIDDSFFSWFCCDKTTLLFPSGGLTPLVLIKWLFGQTYLIAASILLAAARNWYLTIPVAVALGFFLVETVPSVVDIKGGLLGIIPWLGICTVSLLAASHTGVVIPWTELSTKAMGALVNQRSVGILANISVLELTASVLYTVFLIVHQIFFGIARAIANRFA